MVFEVNVPGAGTLRAAASSAVRVRVGGKHSKARGRKRGTRARTTVQTRVVATRDSHPANEGLSTLTLALARRYSSLAKARGGLSSTVALTFQAAGRKTLRQSVQVTFARTVHAAAKKKRPAKKRRPAHGSRR